MKEQEPSGDQQLSEAEQRRQEVELSPDFRAYIDELATRLMTYARLAASIPAGAYGSVEWLREVGHMHWEAREASGLSTVEVARRMHARVNEVRFFEFGVGYLELGLAIIGGHVDLSVPTRSYFPQSYASAIGRPELYDQFRERFLPGQNPPATARAQV